MAKQGSKTLKDLLLNEGVKERYFWSSKASKPGIYRVLGIETELLEEYSPNFRRACLEIEYIGKEDNGTYLISLGRVLNDRVATPKDVERRQLI